MLTKRKIGISNLLNTLQSKLIALLVVFSLITAFVIGGISIYMNINDIKQKAFQSNQTIAGNIGNEIDRFMIDAQGLVETLANSPTSRSMDAASVKEMILVAQQKNPQFELIFVMDTNGMQIARTSGNLANRADRGYFKEAMKGATFFTDNYISSFTKAPTVTISTPIKDATGKIVGVFAADISLKVLWDIAEKTAIGQNGYVDIVDNKGVLIAHPDKEKVLKTENVGTLEYVKNVIGGQAGTALASSTNGQEAVIAFAPLKSQKWGVITYLPYSELLTNITKMMLTIAILISIAVVMAAVVAVFVARGIARPLKAIAMVADKMSKGDLSQKFVPTGSDEVRQLAASLENTRVGLIDIVNKIKSNSEQVAASAEELHASAEQSAQATTQVASSISDVANGVATQAETVDATVSVIEQMSNSIQQVAQNTDGVTGISEKTASAARSGSSALEAAVKQIASIEKTVLQSAQVVSQLGNRSKEIGQIVDTIANIAGQTNLLALNAAIEAARAGENGRGFAVVADEVRKLAEQSQEAAKQIATLINEIQVDTENAVSAMAQGTSEVKIGSEVINNAGQSFEDIVILIDDMSTQIKDISTSIQQTAGGSQRVVASIKTIEQISHQASDQTHTVSAATEEQSAAMEQIAAFSQELAKLAEDLHGSVSQFKVS